MSISPPSSRDISRKLVALIFGANFFGALMIFLYFSVIDPLPVGGVTVRALQTEDVVTFGIAMVMVALLVSGWQLNGGLVDGLIAANLAGAEDQIVNP